jgi:hypothetical protein
MARTSRPLPGVLGITFVIIGCAPPADSAGTPAPGSESVQVTPPATPTPPTTSPAVDEAPTTPSDHLALARTKYSQLLRQLIDEQGMVRYGLLDDPGRIAPLELVVTSYATAPLPTERNARLAMWCNAYNANVLVLAHRASRRSGFVSVEKEAGFFDGQTVTVAGRSVTLNDLENKLIRPLGDPRIHAALVCAARSCPPLRNEPFDPAGLDEQLDDQCRRWINDPSRNRAAGSSLALSRIFQWYGQDFTGPPHDGVAGFVKRFAAPDGAIGRLLAEDADPSVTFLEYDWTLNSAP